MDQLLLALAEPPPQTLDNFAVGRNAESLAALKALAGGQAPAPLIYLWGEGGCGRSHLLAGTASAYRLLAAPALPLTVRDDVETLDQVAQHALFQAVLAAMAGEGLVLVAGALPPASLPLREDLRSRLGAGLVYRITPLSDGEKLTALNARARHLGFELPEDVARYLLNHTARELSSLVRTLDALDRLSAKLKRPITLTLVRECLYGRQDPIQ